MFQTSPFSPETVKHYINGEWISGGTIRESSNPATDEVLGSYYDADVGVATAAISAAHRAFVSTDWRHNRELRAKVLWDLASAIEDNIDTLALAITLENGKPLGKAQLELRIAAPKLRYFAGLALTDPGTAATVHKGSTSPLLHEPLGAAGVIVPWNSPGILLVRSLAPALAAGCTAAVKMPGQTALTNSLIAATFAGVSSLPAGVLNMFTESGDAGAKELVSSPDIAVVSYTGSTAVGAQIASAAGASLKKVSLELGGKTPMIVFNDADLDAVVPTLVAGITEAIERANATDYGLAASVWTRDGARSVRVSLQIEAGTVWTNAWAQILDQFEEGGYKKSGIGRLNGPGGLAEFQQVKHLYRTAM